MSEANRLYKRWSHRRHQVYPLRKIVKRQLFRHPSTPRYAQGTVQLTLECGHVVFCKASKEPKDRARCRQCQTEKAYE